MNAPLESSCPLRCPFSSHWLAAAAGRRPLPCPQAAEGTLSLAPDQPVHLAVVAGEAANSPTHDYTGEVLSSLLTTLCRQGGHLTLVEADGAPYLLYSEAVAAPDASLTENKQDQIVQAQVTQAAAFLTENAVPKTAEVDFVAALDLAALGLQGQAGNRVLYAAFNGLSTAGPMDFTQNLRADPEAVADALRPKATWWTCPGSTWSSPGWGMAGEQAPSPLSAKERTSRPSGRPTTRCGAASVTFPGSTPPARPPPAAPPHPCACASGRAPVLPGPGGRAGVDDTSPPVRGRRGHLPGRGRAQETLAPVAEALRANPQQQVHCGAPTPASRPGRPPARPSARPGRDGPGHP